MNIVSGASLKPRAGRLRSRISLGAVLLCGVALPASVAAQETPPATDAEVRPTATTPSAAASAKATAPDAGDEGAVVNDIVVTARKREERLQDVPIAIYAATGESIRTRGIDNLEELSQTVPNLFVSENTTVDLVGIRGLHSGQNFGFEQAVGQVVDGFFYGRPRLTRLPFFDIERVEVLKGPQGALIGKNTTAGAINITTRRPTDAFEASGLIEYEKFDDAGDGYKAEAAVSGPIAGGVRGRLAVLRQAGGGYIRNLANNTNVPDKDDWIGRLVLDWAASDALDFTLRWTRADLHRDGQSKQLVYCSPTVIAFLTSRGLGVDCGKPNKVTYGLGPRNGVGNFDQFNTDLDTVGLTTNLKLGEHVLTSLTGYGQYKASDNTEGDRTELEIQNTRFRDDYEQYSQELRLASPATGLLTYIGGLYYSHRTNFNRFSFDTDFRPVFAPNPVPFPFPVPAAFPAAASSQNSFTREKADTYAVFGQLTLNATDQLSVTVDGRYTREDKKASQRAFYGLIYSDEPLPPVPIPPFLQGPPFFLPAQIVSLIHQIDRTRKEKNFSPGVVLQFKPNRDAMLYASARRGFKGGGFNFGNLDTQANVPFTFEYEPEKVTAYELGSKLSFLNGAAKLNVALYYMDFQNLQVSSVDTNVLIGIALQRTTNAASSISKGFEVDASWAATDRLRLDASLGYNSAKYDSYPNVACYGGQTVALGCGPGLTPSPRDDVQDLSGKVIANAPKWSGAGSIQYRFPLAGGYNLTAFTQALYRSSYFTLDTLDPMSRQRGYAKFDARLSLAPPNRRWEVSLIGRNLTDKLTSSFIQPLAPIIENPSRTYNAFVDPGRSFLIQARLRY